MLSDSNVTEYGRVNIEFLSNGAVVNDIHALTMSKAVATDGTATITFTTSTAIAPAHATDNKVILTFPAGLVTAGTGCAISSPATTGTVTYGTDAITITLGSTATLAAGAVTVTCTGLTLAAQAAVTATATGTTGMKIETSKDNIAAYVSTPAVGAVTAVSLKGRQATGTGQTATVTFVTSTTLVESSANKISLTFPSNLIAANPDNSCGISSSSTATTSKYSSNTITLTLAPFSRLSAGEVTVTCSGLTLAASAAVTATSTGTTGLKIETSTDTIPAYISTPIIGGVSAELNALQLSRDVEIDNTATGTFKTSTPFTADATSNKITLSFPAGLVTAQAINLCSITSPASVVSTSVYAANSIALTVTSALAAGSVTVTCTGLTLAAKAAVAAVNTVGSEFGLKIETTKDTISTRVSVPCIGCVVADAAALAQGSVSDHEVLLKIRLSFVDALTLYAIRRFKIESYETDVTTRLTPLQPSLQRSNAVVDGYFVGKAKPVDFACTELDLSAMPNGTKHSLPPAFAHTRLQERAWF